MTPRLALFIIAGFLGASVLSSTPLLGQAIRLGDVTAGGDGTGTAPLANTGVDERNGGFTTDYLDGPVSEGDALDDGINPSPVPDSPYLDSVFFIDAGGPGTGLPSQAITQSGVRFDSFQPSDPIGSSRNYLLKDRNGGVSSPGISVGGLEVPTGSAVGVHASAGITYDLDALRARHGPERVGCFSAFWGLDGCDAGDVNLYAILSSDAGVIAGAWRTFRAFAGAGEWVQMEIPATARYLTLATGTNNGGRCGHGTFGDAKLTCSPCPLPSFTDLASVAPRIIAPGTPVTLTGKELSPDFLYLIGGQPVTGVVPVDALRTQVRGIAPALSPGGYDVQVALPTGGPLACLKDGVRAIPPPAITAVAPSLVSTAGGTTVEITGQGFSADMVARLGGRPLLGQTLFDSTRIRGESPPLPAGSYAAEVAGSADPAGGVLARLEGAVQAAVPSTIAGVDPVQVSRDGSTAISIRGANFLAATRVQIGSHDLAGLQVVSSSLIRGMAPALGNGEPNGPRYVTAEDTRGSATLAVGITYITPVVPGTFYWGDSNSDNQVDLSDVIFTLDYIFLGGRTPKYLGAADANEDGRIDIADAIRLILYLFGGDTIPALLRPPVLPPPQYSGVWGFADLHTHPASHLAFSSDGDNGIFHGKPGLDLASAQQTLTDDLKSCAPDVHDSSTDIDFVRHATREVVLSSLNAITQHPHGKYGYPSQPILGGNYFNAWPHARSVLHQQMHVLSVRRAYDAGLRLLFASVTDNQLLDSLYNNGFNLFGNNPQPEQGFDAKHAAVQIDFIRKFAQANSSWMEVVESSAAARNAINAGKLAVVLSLEMDKLTLEEVLQLVQDKGARHVIPIHLVNNDFGGAAVYSDVFNVSNRFQNGEYLHVEGAPSIQLRLGWPQKLDSHGLLFGWSFTSLGAVDAKLIDRSEFCQLCYEPCAEAPLACAVPLDQGHRNVQGLNSSSIQRLMKAGLMVDVAHMSEKSINDALWLAESFGYPLMDSHTGFRSSKVPSDPLPSILVGPPSPKPKKRVLSERDLTFEQAKRIAALGGVVGIGTEGRLEPQSLAAFEFNPAIALNNVDGHTLKLSLTLPGTLSATDQVASLEVRVLTGGDDLQGGNENAFGQVDLKNVQAIEVPLNNGAHWNSSEFHTVSIPLPSATLLQDVTGFGIRTTVSSWYVDQIIVTAVGLKDRMQVMFREGTPFRKFSGNYKAWKEPIDLSLPNPQTLVKRVHFIFGTGGDDLRGDTDNAWVEVRRLDTVSRRLMVNARQGWQGYSTHDAWLDMPPATHLGDLASIKLETTFGGGNGGDNWNVDSIVIETDDGNGGLTTLFKADGRPWQRFTGDHKFKVVWQAPPEAAGKSVDASFLRLTVTSGSDGLEDSSTAWAYLRLTNNSVGASINFNLGGKLEDLSTYWRILALPPGTKRGDLQSLEIDMETSSSNSWSIARVAVEVLADPVTTFLDDYNEAVGLMGGTPVALGTDANGFAPQIPFSGASFDYPLHAPRNHAPANLKAQVPLIDRSVFPSRTFDFRIDGVAHYGMLGELIESLDTMNGGPAAVDKLYSSAEATLRMWEACEALAPTIP
jgi:microsomal dipeptidase-like Zn-dependent dipeptidase